MPEISRLIDEDDEMALKQQLAELLKENIGRYISGGEAAKKFGVTRAAVWKAIKLLEYDGYEIDAVTNKGYRLSPESDILSCEGVKRYLSEDFYKKITVLPTVDSTNIYLREAAEKGEPAGSAVIANCQTGGKGRMGRSFVSPDGSGIYLSILLRPEFSAEKSTLITTAAAVAVCQAIENVTGKKPGIKWVNDVFLSGKKVCGILTEAALSMENGRLDYCVVGIGINVYMPDGGFGEDLKSIAGAVLENKSAEMRNRLCAEILNRFAENYRLIDSAGFIDRYRERSIIIGKRVEVISKTVRLPAKVVEIDDMCRLLVEFSDGSRKLLSSGEISTKILE